MKTEIYPETRLLISRLIVEWSAMDDTTTKVLRRPSSWYANRLRSALMQPFDRAAARARNGDQDCLNCFTALGIRPHDHAPHQLQNCAATALRELRHRTEAEPDEHVRRVAHNGIDKIVTTLWGT